MGNILSVTWPELFKTAVLYSLVGLFHYVLRDRFLLISMNEAEAERRGWNIRFWDFLFYVSFGFVVTSSVAIAGVLLVFCFLIVPSVTAMLFSARLGPRLAIGWSMGALVSAGGRGALLHLGPPDGRDHLSQPSGGVADCRGLSTGSRPAGSSSLSMDATVGPSPVRPGPSPGAAGGFRRHVLLGSELFLRQAGGPGD